MLQTEAVGLSFYLPILYLLTYFCVNCDARIRRSVQSHQTFIIRRHGKGLQVVTYEEQDIIFGKFPQIMFIDFRKK
jgi:hypothetical protein